MSGAEAAAVLGLLSSIITIITTAKELYEAANDVNGLPDALRNAETKLPLILMILKEAQSYSKRPDIEPQIYDAFEKIISRGQKKAKELLDILEKVLLKEGASTFDRYRSATRQLMKGSRVEHLMKALFEEVLTLTSYFSCPKPMKAAVKEALEEFQLLSLANLASKDSSEWKALREIKYNAYPSYSDLSSRQDLEVFLHKWLLPENFPGANFESDQAELLKKRFCDPENFISTCDWVFQTTEYSKLIELSNASMLRIKGPSGCGKSVLLSAIIEQLRNQPPGNGTTPVLFCYGRNDFEPISPTTLARVLLAQSLQWKNDEILKELNAFYSKYHILEENDKKVEKELWRLLSTALAFEPRKINIVLDGLDESASPLVCVQYLMKVASKTKCGILLSSRREGREIFNNKAVQATVKKHDISLLQLEMTMDRTLPDLMAYVTYQVNNHNAFSKKSQEIRDKFIRSVCHRADGMFLYANLVLKDLRRDKLSSPSAIDATLAGLPEGLLEVYRSNLELPQHTLKGPGSFCWIYCASSPLSWHEFQSALAIGDSGYDEDEIIDDSCETFVEYSCGQLIESYGDSERLRFIHPTVQDFLAGNLGPGSTLGIPKAHSMVSNKLLTFLEYPDLPLFSSPYIDDNFEALIKAYTSQSGRGLYSYATYNWYRHLKECDNAEDSKLEQHVIRFLMSPAIIRWLKSAIVISHATSYGPADSVSLTVDVIHSLQTWMLGRTWSDPQSANTVQVWIKDFVDLMLDWGMVLETQPDWIHYIHHQLLPEHSCFRRILKADMDESIIQFHPGRVLTRSSQIATWPDHVFVTDLKRDLAFIYHEQFISCYHMRTGLLTAEVAIPFSRHRGSIVLRRGVLCPQGKYLAAIFEVKSSWSEPVRAAIRSGLQLVPEEDGFALKLENPAMTSLDTCAAYMAFGIDEMEFIVCLLELNHVGPARSQLFCLPKWATDPVLVIGKESLRWELDDIDALAFSSDSSRLATPFGIFDLESGEKVNPWSLALTMFFKGGRTTENIDVFNTIVIGGIVEDDNSSIVGFNLQTKAATSFAGVNFPGIGHLLATSNRGRFFLVLRVQTSIASKSRRLKESSGQQGSIEIWDCSSNNWTSLLLLEPAASGRRAPWDLSHLAFPPHFSPEAKEPDDVNRVLVYVPPKWKLASNIRNRSGFDSRQAQLLLFEARKTGYPEEGFGPYPILRHQLPAAAFRRENTSSNLRLTILAWSAPFESAIVYSNQQVVSMTQDEMRKSALAILKTNQSKKEAEKLRDSHANEYSAFIFSADHSASFHIQIRVIPLGSNENSFLSTKDQLPASEQGLSKYEIFVGCLRTGEMEPEYSSVQHPQLPAIQYPPLNSQYLNASDEEHIRIGCLDLNLCHDYDGMSIEVKHPGETVFDQALQCFKRTAHPLKCLSQSSEISVIRKGSEITYTIFSQSEIVFKQDDALSAALNSGGFLARESNTMQETLHIFEFSKALGDNISTDGVRSEARRFEVYLCIYDESISEISWLVHAITAGETDKSTGAAPETAWALHPQLPLLVWLLPGHRLRLSNIQSNDSPITIAESLAVEDNSTQPMFFSPNGRYIALQAQETFKYPWAYNISQSIGSVVLCDLFEGKTVIATPTVASSVSIDIDDGFLHVYNLTREGGIQSSSYQLPGLELKQRQYLSFIPANCCCSTCGHSIQDTPNISIIEHQGVKFVALGHLPTKIGTATMGAHACEPFMLRITSPPVNLNMNAVYDAYLTIASTYLFPKIIDEEGELLVDAFAPSYRACSKNPGIECSCPVCRAQALPIPRITAVPQMQTIIRDFELTTGERILHDEVEEQLRRIEVDKAKELVVDEKDTFTTDEAKRILGEEVFPWDNWEEFCYFKEEIKDEYDYEAHLENIFDPANRGTGCRIPLLVQTFSFEKGTEAKAGFRWSSAMGVGWIEEDIMLFFGQLFTGSMAGSRRVYPFPALMTLTPRIEDLAKDQSSKGKRFRRIVGEKWDLGQLEMDLEADQNSHSADKDDAKGELSIYKLTETKKGKKLKSRAPAILLKEGDAWDPLLPVNDVLDVLSDIVPGMGDIFKYRIKSFMMQDLIVEGLE